MATDSSASTKAPVALGTSPIGKLLLQYSLPAIVASLVTSLYNIIDSIFIGRGVGPLAISGLAITFPLMNLVVAFCVLIASGGATLSSIFLGQKNYTKATDTLSNVALLCIVHSIIIGGLGLLFLDDILYLFGATEGTISYAREFMRVILLGTPISYLFIGLNNIMRATGYPKKAMVSALLSVGVNVVLAPIFIFVLHWGIAGAAFATILGQLSAFIWILCHFLSRKSFIHFRRGARYFIPGLIRNIYSIGMSPFLMNCCACLVVVFVNKSLLESAAELGDIAVGAYGIINRTSMFFVMIVFGVTQGMQPILGFNYGACNWPRVKATLNKGILIGTLISSTGWAATELFPDTITNLFTTDQSMIDIARNGFRIFFVAFPVVGSQIVIQNYFQSIGMPKLSIFLSLTRQLIFLLPLLWILPPRIGVEGVWVSMAGSDFIAAILAITTMLIMNRKIAAKLNSTPKPDSNA